jgi:1,4-dihydroxy-2-naphthoate octaprenyltransferase
MKGSDAAVWILAARPKTLWAAVAPVVLGTAMAVEVGAFHWLSAMCALLAAVLIQIGTNYSNDYHDFVKGADTSLRKGPLRVTQAGLVAPAAVRRAASIAFTLAFAAGLYLVWRGGWPILLVGLLSILFGTLYTAGRFSLSYLGVADLFVLVFFGPVALAGTYYVQALALPWYVVVAGLGPGFLSTAILLVNNTRDVDEDRAAGKRTIVVRMGRDFGVILYGVAIAAAALVPIVLAVALGDHYWSISASVSVGVLSPGIIRKLRVGREGPDLNPLLGATSRLLLIYSLLFGVGWLL